MASVRISRQKGESGHLPPVCLCCGAAAQSVTRHTFSYMPTWLVFMRFLLPWILNLIYSRTNVTLMVPLCAQHKHRLKLGTYMAYGLIALLFIGIFASIGLNAAGNANAGGVIAAVCVFVMLAMLVALLVIQINTPRLEELEGGRVGLTAVSPQFVVAVQQPKMVNTPTPTPRGPDRVAGPAYMGATSYGGGTAPRAASKKSSNTRTTILVAFGTVALVCILVCSGVAAIVIRGRSRPSDLERAASAANLRDSVSSPPGHRSEQMQSTPMPRADMNRSNITAGRDFSDSPSKRAFDETVRKNRAAFEAAKAESERMMQENIGANTSLPGLEDGDDPESFRTWTDSTGKHKTEAHLLRVADGKVTLKRVDGKVVTIPLERLSQQDQDYVDNLP